MLTRLLLWLALACGIGLASAAPADLQAVPPFSAPLVDQAGLLQLEQAAQLDRHLREFAQAHGSQIAVLIVPTTQPETIEQYSIRVFDGWKIGREKQNDGILIVVAVKDRKLRIDTGYGLEGAIPDAFAKRIVAEIMSPKFRDGDAYGGLLAGIDQIGKLIQGEQLPQPPPSAQAQQGGQGSEGQLSQMLVIGIVAATIVGGVLSAVLGRFFGSLATAGVVGTIAWLISSSLLVMLASAVIVFLYVLMTGGRGGSSLGGFGGGGFGGGGFGGGGGWSGGGGSSGGGGASGGW